MGFQGRINQFNVARRIFIFFIFSKQSWNGSEKENHASFYFFYFDWIHSCSQVLFLEPQKSHLMLGRRGRKGVVFNAFLFFSSPKKNYTVFLPNVLVLSWFPQKVIIIICLRRRSFIFTRARYQGIRGT